MTRPAPKPEKGGEVRPWCIRHRDGWCATNRKRAPREVEDSARTVCKHYVILGWGWARRTPTCEDCLRRLAACKARRPR